MTKYSDEEMFVSQFDDPVLVSFNYYKGSPGSMYKRNGDPGDPPEGSEVDIICAMYNGVDVYDELNDEDKAMIRESCFEIAEEDER